MILSTQHADAIILLPLAFGVGDAPTDPEAASGHGETVAVCTGGHGDPGAKRDRAGPPADCGGFVRAARTNGQRAPAAEPATPRVSRYAAVKRILDAECVSCSPQYSPSHPARTLLIRPDIESIVYPHRRVGGNRRTFERSQSPTIPQNPSKHLASEDRDKTPPGITATAGGRSSWTPTIPRSKLHLWIS